MMDIRRIALVGATLLMAVLLAACATAEPNQPPTGGAALPGTEWGLTSLAGNIPIEGTQITLSFGGGSLEGSGGCNTYGGSYTATGDSLRLSDLYWTEMACLEPEGILDQEMVFLNALDSVASYRMDAGRLELYDAARTQILVFALQETARADPTEITPDQTEPPAVQGSGLIASLEAPESLTSGAVVPVRFTLTNTLSEGIFVLTWFTPLEGLVGDIFRVEREAVELTYRGKMVKRGPPTAEDYVWLDAGGSLLTEVDLAEGYDFSQTGQYTVQFRSPRLSHTAKTSGERADSFEELAAVEIPSDPVNMTIE
jgi:heat shock protein HslJ